LASFLPPCHFWKIVNPLAYPNHYRGAGFFPFPESSSTLNFERNGLSSYCLPPSLFLQYRTTFRRYLSTAVVISFSREVRWCSSHDDELPVSFFLWRFFSAPSPALLRAVQPLFPFCGTFQKRLDCLSFPRYSLLSSFAVHSSLFLFRPFLDSSALNLFHSYTAFFCPPHPRVLFFHIGPTLPSPLLDSSPPPLLFVFFPDSDLGTPKPPPQPFGRVVRISPLLVFWRTRPIFPFFVRTMSASKPGYLERPFWSPSPTSMHFRCFPAVRCGFMVQAVLPFQRVGSSRKTLPCPLLPARLCLSDASYVSSFFHENKVYAFPFLGKCSLHEFIFTSPFMPLGCALSAFLGTLP